MKKPLLDDNEWNFDKCVDDERAVCFHYEYARQYLLARPDLAKKWIDQPRKRKVSNFLNFEYSDKKRSSDGLPVFCDHFPASSWLELPREERLELLNFRNQQRLAEPGSELITSSRIELSHLVNFDRDRQRHFDSWQQKAAQWLETNGYVEGKELSFSELLAAYPAEAINPSHFYAYSGHINYALITLDWSKSNNHLRRAFAQLLKRRPPEYSDSDAAAKERAKKPKTLFKKLGGRGGPFDRLRQLAVLRLLRHCESSESVVDFLSERKTYLPYTNAKNVEKAARKACVTLEEMESAGHFWIFSELFK